MFKFNWIFAILTGSNFALADVSDIDHLRHIPRESTLQTTKAINVIPNTTTVCFKGGSIVGRDGCACIEFAASTEDDRLIRPSRPLTITRKQASPSPHGDWFELTVDSPVVKAVSLYERNYEGCGTGTIGDLRRHFGDYLRLNLAPPIDVDAEE